MLAVLQGADLHCSAQTGGRDPRGEVDRGVQIGRLVEELAAKSLLDGDGRAIGGERRTPLDADGGGRLGALQPHVGGGSRPASR